MLAVALLSGGLDSTLAIKLMIDQGVDVEALNFSSVFCTCTPKSNCCSAAQVAVRQLGVRLKVMNCSEEIIQLVKQPRHGYGSGMNACLDCRILKFRKAHEYMKQLGGSFLITGEALGQRPMSQRRDAMKLIEKEAGVEGLVVRPLSAARLEPSIPEKEGWIDRSKLLSIQGRSRKPQIELAQKFGITDYPCPAGGCRLTDPGFAQRMRDLMQHRPDFTVHDATLLRFGRHLRLSPHAKAIVGRDEEENNTLRALGREEDTLLEVVDFAGPLTLVRGQTTEADLLLSAEVTAWYSKAKHLGRVEVAVMDGRGSPASTRHVAPADEGRAAELMIGQTVTAQGANPQDFAGR